MDGFCWCLPTGAIVAPPCIWKNTRGSSDTDGMLIDDHCRCRWTRVLWWIKVSCRRLLLVLLIPSPVRIWHNHHSRLMDSILTQGKQRKSNIKWHLNFVRTANFWEKAPKNRHLLSHHACLLYQTCNTTVHDRWILDYGIHMLCVVNTCITVSHLRLVNLLMQG